MVGLGNAPVDISNVANPLRPYVLVYNLAAEKGNVLQMIYRQPSFRASPSRLRGARSSVGDMLLVQFPHHYPKSHYVTGLNMPVSGFDHVTLR